MNEEDINELLSSLTEMGATWGIRIVGVLVALFFAWIIAGWLSRSLRNGLEKKSFDPTLTRFFSKVVRYAIITFAVLGCLGVFGIETTSFAAVIAAAGLAVGLAFQGTLSNFASGIMLLVFRPFKVGDLVKVAGEMGTIEEIELFTTELKTYDARRIIVPNTTIFGNKIENLTHHPQRRVDIPVGVEYPADIDQTRKVLEDMAPNIPGVITDPPPQIFLKELGGSSVDWQVRVWCNAEDYWDVHQATVRAAKKALDEAGLGIPFPQLDVHFDEPGLKALSGKS